MITKKHIRFGAGLMFAAFSLNSQAEKAGLMTVYREAVQNDQLFAAAEQARLAGIEQKSQGRATLLPQLSASYSIDRTKTTYDNPTATLTDSSATNSGASLSLVQPIYRWTNFMAAAQGSLAAEQAEVQFLKAQQDFILRVTGAYFDVLSAEESVAVAKAQKAAFAASLERAELSFKVGSTTITDKLEAQARYDLSVSAEIAAANALAIAKQALIVVIGRVPEELKALPEKVTLPEIEQAQMQYWVDKALAQNHDLMLAEKALALATKQLSSARGEHGPTLDFIASYSSNDQYNLFSNDNVSSTSTSARLQLELPIFSGGLTASKVREAGALRNQAKDQLEQARRQVSLQAQSAYLDVVNGRAQILALEKALASSQSAEKATRKGVEVGVRTQPDLLDAQQQVFATRRDLAVARYDYLQNTLRLKAAIGQLSETDLTAMEPLLSR